MAITIRGIEQRVSFADKHNEAQLLSAKCVINLMTHENMLLLVDQIPIGIINL